MSICYVDRVLSLCELVGDTCIYCTNLKKMIFFYFRFEFFITKIKRERFKNKLTHGS